MPEEEGDQEMAELRALIASNAEAMQKLRAMLERLEVTLAGLADKPRPEQGQTGGETARTDD
jgi:hypothetical protein